MESIFTTLAAIWTLLTAFWGVYVALVNVCRYLEPIRLAAELWHWWTTKE